MPDDIIRMKALPRTRSGKRLEIPVKRILLGSAARQVVSLDSLDDPEGLFAFEAIAKR